jgi:hypothetical protein
MAAALVTTRRFLPPRSVEEQPACFAVRDHNGQPACLRAFVYPGPSLAASINRPSVRHNKHDALLRSPARCNSENLVRAAIAPR